MSDLGDREELVGYLVKTTRLTPPEAARVVAETLAFLTETPEAFIRRRHHALQAEGLSNPAIFERSRPSSRSGAFGPRRTRRARSAE